MNYKRSKGWETPKLQRPTITARSTERAEPSQDITIQALAMHPDLLPLDFKPVKKRKKAHDTACECEECEHGEEDLRELDF